MFIFASSQNQKNTSDLYKVEKKIIFWRDLTLGEFGCFYAHKRVLEKR